MRPATAGSVRVGTGIGAGIMGAGMGRRDARHPIALVSQSTPHSVGSNSGGPGLPLGTGVAHWQYCIMSSYWVYPVTKALS